MRPAKRRADAVALRRIWRLHFWVGLFAAPALVLLACSGLVILYTQPINDWLHRDLYVVASGPETIPLDDQIAVSERNVGADYILDAVIPPAGPESSTRVDFLPPNALSLPAGEADLTQVFVDPYNGRYLGQRSELSGLVGWANQLHRLFGNDGPQVHLPSLGHLIAPSSYPDATIAVGVGNLWMELTAVWILVLMASGIYLWWPRAIEATKPLLRIRWARGGRVRWRDLHALTGVVIAVVLICYVLSGLTWSRYWGENWRAVTAAVTPSTEVDAPSTMARMGDYDRLGRRISWAATDDPVYSSATDGARVPARLSFADIDRLAKGEHMVPGFAIIPPVNVTENGQTVYGSFTVVNAWPQKLSEQRTLYLNQFTGRTITNATAEHDGALSRLTSFGIAMHMGNQLGLLTRIVATLACLGILASALTGLLMWWSRRPSGHSGVPGPVSDVTRANTPRSAVIAVSLGVVVLGIVFPVFGVSVLVVLAVEAVMARRPRKREPDTARDAEEAKAFRAPARRCRRPRIPRPVASRVGAMIRR
ncbi:putative iron-regulated membrane protein [Mycolicibacterium rhodesiae NBB3]|uniref:Putative iron-regulated membrane protein n=1 Tax=Mycolicibacterium rhodesiae (strain NBB3) TaxID=710685 RepID=G8RVM8_MYCRN|nr:PepSY domain-containing protein [Mycolicibacterium rhodesiae]AEV74275.1 putative iron-regulated membrane protein [Mycolicibacterium rhodesiae NBB3]